MEWYTLAETPAQYQPPLPQAGIVHIGGVPMGPVDDVRGATGCGKNGVVVSAPVLRRSVVTVLAFDVLDHVTVILALFQLVESNGLSDDSSLT